MQHPFALLATLALLFSAPAALAAENADGMYARLLGDTRPFSGSIRPGSGCGGCGGCALGSPTHARKSAAEIQMSVLMPMVFQLDLSPEQKHAIEHDMQSIAAAPAATPAERDRQRIRIMQTALTHLTAEQRAALIRQIKASR